MFDRNKAHHSDREGRADIVIILFKYFMSRRKKVYVFLNKKSCDGWESFSVLFSKRGMNGENDRSNSSGDESCTCIESCL